MINGIFGCVSPICGGFVLHVDDGRNVVVVELIIPILSGVLCELWRVDGIMIILGLAGPLAGPGELTAKQ